MLRIETVNAPLQSVSCDVLVVNLFAGVNEPAGATGAADAALGGLVQEAIAAGDLKGKLGEVTIFYSAGRLPARKVLVVGLGEKAEFDTARARRVAASAARAARRSGARVIASIVHGAGSGGLDPTDAAAALVDGTLHGLYRFAGYGSEPAAADHPTTFVVVEGDAARLPAVSAGVQRGEILGRAAAWARDLANTPGNHLTPAGLADAAAAMARSTGLECSILGPAEIADAGLHLLLSVARGSDEEPRCIVLRYRGGGSGGLLGLVGKGLTFDSGGISIKPTENMWDMKYDMCGGAAVLGAMRAIAELRPAAEVLAVVPCSENMPDGRALKPGDVIRGLSGKSVEIRSTDAEGRLILADGLAYAVNQGVQRLITVSTLTGGVSIALGSHRFALIANDDPWYEQVAAAVAVAGERGWRLPSDPEYRDLFKSEIADMTNGGKREASTIQGGMFLLQHVGKTPTVHLDIAAAAWGKGDAQQDAGATGVGLRSLVAAAGSGARP